MRLMYIASIDFYSKPNPSFHLMTSMMEDVLSSGIEIELIGCREENIEKHIPEQLEDNDKFQYELIDVPQVKKSNFIQRYLEGIKYSIKVGKIIKRKIEQCDCVFIQSSPTVLYTIYFARKYAKNKKIIYNIQDMFPGSSIASGVMPQRWMQRIFYTLQKIAYKKADVITVISEDMKHKVVEQGVDPKKIEVIVNWFDDNSVHEVKWEDNRFVKKYNMSKDIFYVQYAGTMGYVFDYQAVLSVADRLKERKNIVFQMIGMGSQKQVFMMEAKNRQLENIVFLPLEPQEMVSDVYSACSLCYIPLKKGIIGNSVPSKAGLLMACNRPIITSADINSFYCRSFKENKMGIAKDSRDIDGIVKSIIYLSENKDIGNELALNGFKYGCNLYSRRYNMQKYISLFEKIARRR